MTIYATRTDGPTYATRTNSGPTYAKIIGKNHGSYPYRVGRNTLAHNGETFNLNVECAAGGLYFCELKNVLRWLEHGDQLCIVKPVGQIVPVGDKFKTDKLVIESMMSLLDIETWKFLIENGVDVSADNYLALQWATINGNYKYANFLVELGADVTGLPSILRLRMAIWRNSFWMHTS